MTATRPVLDAPAELSAIPVVPAGASTRPAPRPRSGPWAVARADVATMGEAPRPTA